MDAMMNIAAVAQLERETIAEGTKIQALAKEETSSENNTTVINPVAANGKGHFESSFIC